MYKDISEDRLSIRSVSTVLCAQAYLHAHYNYDVQHVHGEDVLMMPVMVIVVAVTTVVVVVVTVVAVVMILMMAA